MITTIDYPKTKLAEPPAQPVEEERKEYPNRKLTSLYIKEEKKYLIDCISLNNKATMQFSHPVLGDAFFDRVSGTFIRSTKALDEHYFKYLERAIKQWKTQFPNH